MTSLAANPTFLERELERQAHKRLIKTGVLPEHLRVELRRVMDALFAT